MKKVLFFGASSIASAILGAYIAWRYERTMAFRNAGALGHLVRSDDLDMYSKDKPAYTPEGFVDDSEAFEDEKY